MLTINLEKKLIASKAVTIKKLVGDTAQQEVLLANVKNLLDTDVKEDLNVLNRAGFGTAISNARQVSNRIASNKDKASNLAIGRIFSKEEIKKIAIEYNLRFLATEYYKGSLPNDLASKVKEAEEVTKSLVPNHYGPRYNYYILAPKEAFKLEARPKDPLLFIELADGNYYLVHKWGDDLSIFKSTKVLTILAILFLIVPTLYLSYAYHPVWFILTIIFGIVIGGMLANEGSNEANWDSKFKD